MSWAARVTNTTGEKVVTDKDGNIYFLGKYNGNAQRVITIYSADGTVFSTFPALPVFDTYAAFLVKYDTNGVVQWVTRASRTTSSGGAVAVDSVGNVYISVVTQGSPFTVFNANGTTFGSITPDGSGSGVIIKYNTSGFAQWILKNGGSSFAGGAGMSIDANDNIYVAYAIAGNNVRIRNADDTTFKLFETSIGSADSFVSKYNTNGVCQWTARSGGSANDYSLRVTADSSGNVIVVGTTTSTALFTINSADDSTFGSFAASSSSGDMFVIKYSSTGYVSWFARTSGSGSNGVSVDSVIVAPTGDIYAAGSYSGSAFTLFNASGSSFSTLASASSTDAFIVKYTPGGEIVWAIRNNGTDYDRTYDLALDKNGNLYAVGWGAGTFTFRNANGTTFGTLTMAGSSNDCYIVKYTSAGIGVWRTRLGSSGGDGATGCYFTDSLAVCGSFAAVPFTLRSVGF